MEKPKLQGHVAANKVVEHLENRIGAEKYNKVIHVGKYRTEVDSTPLPPLSIHKETKCFLLIFKLDKKNLNQMTLVIKLVYNVRPQEIITPLLSVLQILASNDILSISVFHSYMWH